MNKVTLIIFAIFVNTIFAQTIPKLLYDFEDEQLLSNIELIDAKYKIEKTDENNFLSVSSNSSSEISGITITPIDGEFWDFSEFANLNIDVINFSDKPITVWAELNGISKNADDKIVPSRVPFAVNLGIGKRGNIVINIYAFGKKLLEDISIKGSRGLPVGTGNLNAAKINGIRIYINKPVENYYFGIDNISLFGKVEVIESNSFFPFIDSLGQYKHSNWLGKTKSIKELKSKATFEKETLQNDYLHYKFDKYGGWESNIKSEATGFFYSKKIDGKWWLIDPEGNLFFSHGVNGVANTAPTGTDFREEYFEYLPSKDGKLAECWSVGNWAPHGFYKDHIPFSTFDFMKANLIRKYGENWEKRNQETTSLRLKTWGINTIGNWSESFMYSSSNLNKVPYVLSGSSENAKSIEGSSGHWRKFPDPFDKSFRKSIRESLESYADNVANNPYCIGFFVDNEQSWGNDVSLAISTLQSSKNQAAKIVLLNDLKKKYKKIDNLNSLWKTKYSSWDVFLNSRRMMEEIIQNAKTDLYEFNSKLVREYFEISREEVKRVAPNQMYLGCRFSAEMMDNKVLQLLAQEYCDVITYNIYNLLPVGFTEDIDKPIIIGEFHFGALDRGMFHTGLWYAKNQEERAELYKKFVEFALAHPLIVGTHWFQYSTQAATGRADGENFQIGLIDICDKPYQELIQAVKSVSKKMYQVRVGARQ